MTRKEEAPDDSPRDVESYTETFAWTESGDHAPSQIVVEAVTEATDRAPEEIRPLFEVIDPDALDSLFERSASRHEADVSGHVIFEFEGCEIRVEADGRTVVVPLEDRSG